MNVDAIPAELRDRRQWVTWRLEERDGKSTKVPYRADGVGRASSTDAATWSTFDAAVAGRHALNADGIGFVFSDDDGLVGIDLDALDADAAAIIAALDSYTETSVSGRGAHVIVRACLNGHGRNRKGPLEVYDRGRYFVVTGDHMTGTPNAIEERQEQLERVLAHFLPAEITTVRDVFPIPVDLDDVDLIDKARAARNGRDFAALYAGSWDLRYPSQSEADLALCSMLAFWTGRDGDRIDRIFRSSGLYREKWERPDYRNRTIDEALSGCRETYEPRRTEPRSEPPPVVPTEKPGSTRRLVATPVSTLRMRSIEWLERPRWQRSAFQLLSGAKGSGKGTYLAGLEARVSRAGENVLVVSSEDSAEIDLKPRLVAAGANIDRCFVIQEHVLLPDDVDVLRELALDLGGVGLLVIDPLANHAGRSDSNSDVDVRHAIAPLNKLADDLGCLLVGVRHPGKDRSRGALASILGSTAWVDTPRAVVMIAVDDEDPDVRHIQVVAGNRARSGKAQAFRIEAVPVEGLAEPITLAVDLGESEKSVDALLETREVPETKTGKARDLILDLLEEEGEQESDALDAHVANELGLSARTVRDARMKLSKEGLVQPVPIKDEEGEIVRWHVRRTGAKR